MKPLKKTTSDAVKLAEKAKKKKKRKRWSNVFLHLNLIFIASFELKMYYKGPLPISPFFF